MAKMAILGHFLPENGEDIGPGAKNGHFQPDRPKMTPKWPILAHFGTPFWPILAILGHFPKGF